MQRPFSIFIKHQGVSLAGLEIIAANIAVTVQQFSKVETYGQL